MIRDRFQKVYNPGQNLSVDESLILFKDRLHFCQYIKTKRACFGINLYELITSDGITRDVLVYCRAGMFDDDENSSVPSSKCIPVELMTPFLDKGHVLFTENYYTSPALASFLLNRKVYLNRTIRMNTKFHSKEIMDEQLERGTTVFYKTTNDINNKMVACKYRANQDKSGNKQKVCQAIIIQ